MSVKVMKVIVTDLEVRGKGTDESPMRRVTQFYGFDGKLLAEVDHYQERPDGVADLERVIEAQKKALEAARAEIAEARLVFEKGEMGEVLKQEDMKTVVGRQMRTVMQAYWSVKGEKGAVEEKLAEVQRQLDHCLARMADSERKPAVTERARTEPCFAGAATQGKRTKRSRKA